MVARQQVDELAERPAAAARGRAKNSVAPPISTRFTSAVLDEEAREAKHQRVHGSPSSLYERSRARPEDMRSRGSPQPGPSSVEAAAQLGWHERASLGGSGKDPRAQPGDLVVAAVEQALGQRLRSQRRERARARPGECRSRGRRRSGPESGRPESGRPGCRAAASALGGGQRRKERRARERREAECAAVAVLGEHEANRAVMAEPAGAVVEERRGLRSRGAAASQPGSRLSRSRKTAAGQRSGNGRISHQRSAAANRQARAPSGSAAACASLRRDRLGRARRDDPYGLGRSHTCASRRRDRGRGGLLRRRGSRRGRPPSSGRPHRAQGRARAAHHERAPAPSATEAKWIARYTPKTKR